ncbi:SPOR domain-containing protein [Maritimibacter sp. DP4N28-5]|uniref:SPOR domain-containing protein n=2 Tax=Maritimibacter dapengensis TaxID=2836868 RepID=A0ABS6T329_9RHOB|nr:SPOR domain-containing protein [Maritimibacter dapengensis]
MHTHAQQQPQSAAHGYPAAPSQPYYPQHEQDYRAQPLDQDGGSGRFGRLVNGFGAMTSIALIAGLAVWGYNLAVRDATEVPVVAALEGAMRIAPENPGGEAAENQGLAVNNVAAVGVAEGPADQVLLAPGAEDLTPEDAPVVSEPVLAATPEAEAGEFRPEEDLSAEPVSADADDARSDALALADEIASGQEPLSEPEAEASAMDEAVEEAIGSELAFASEEVVTGPGPKVSPRPRARPENLVTRAAAQPSTDALLAATEVATDEVSAADIPAGTRLVQLGAYDTEDVARAEWDQLAGRFDEYLTGKSRVIEQAQSGGKTFYRLRAMGFDDLSDARRFCAALMAGQAACIPVVTR